MPHDDRPRPGLGRVKDPPDARDHHLRRYAQVRRAVELPSYKRGMKGAPVLDQGSTPHCVAFSGASLRTMAERRDEHRTYWWDTTDFYDRCKEIDPWGPSVDGTDIRSACKVLTGTGALITGDNRPGWRQQTGERRKIAAYARLFSIEEIKTAILEYGAAWIGMSWWDSWFFPLENGDLPDPDFLVGGHAFFLDGWSDRRRDGGKPAFMAQNSWGEEWGNRGRFYLPYEYVDFLDADAWRTIDVLGDRD